MKRNRNRKEKASSMVERKIEFEMEDEDTIQSVTVKKLVGLGDGGAFIGYAGVIS
jgi:hypothetical protein